LHKRERYYGKLFNTIGLNGLNCLLPKDKDDSYVGANIKTRKKMSESKLGNKNSFFGKFHSDKTKQKIREFQTGRKYSYEHRQKVSLHNTKNKAKIILDLSTGVYYESAKEASLYNNIKHSTLRSQLNGTNRKNINLIYV